MKNNFISGDYVRYLRALLIMAGGPKKSKLFFCGRLAWFLLFSMQ